MHSFKFSSVLAMTFISLFKGKLIVLNYEIILLLLCHQKLSSTVGSEMLSKNIYYCDSMF